MLDGRCKYPRTFHLPSSLGRGADDRVLPDTAHLDGREVVASVKLDGEATSMYRDGYHARSPEDAYHPSQSWCRALQARIAHDIPPGWRICGENVYARHSIAYRDLPSFFFVYSIWDEHNRALGADATREWCALLGLETVPEFYRGPFDEARIRGLMPAGSGWSDEVEGFVVRLAEPFAYGDFSRSVAKWVRLGHVQPDATHWRLAPITANALGGRAER